MKGDRATNQSGLYFVNITKVRKRFGLGTAPTQQQLINLDRLGIWATSSSSIMACYTMVAVPKDFGGQKSPPSQNKGTYIGSDPLARTPET